MSGINFDEDAEKTPVPTDATLSQLAKLATRQLELEEAVEIAQELLKATKEALRQVSEVQIPELMVEIGMSEFKLKNGMKLSIKDDIFASIRKDMNEKAVSWLEDNGLGDIVKIDVGVKFGRGDQELVKELVLFCKDHRFAAEEKQTINSNTLKATIKEQLAKGVEFPSEYFSIFPFKKSQIKAK